MSVPLPVTVSPPLVPVELSTMPLVAPFDAMLRKVNPAAPIVVFATFRAVPVVVVMVFTMLVLFCVAVTVPPPVAVKAALAPVFKVSPALKAIVAPVLPVREIPAAVSEIAWVKETVDPARLAMVTERPNVVVMGALTETLPFPPERLSTPEEALLLPKSTSEVVELPICAVLMELPVMADVAVMVATDAEPAALAAGLGVAAKNPAG